MRRALGCLLVLATVACGRTNPAPPAAAPVQARNLLIVTIDTLRADRVGAYGYRPARTPVFDALAASGVRFDRAFAAAPITLPSHASLMTGRYPPGHGARDNGMRMDLSVPTLADTLGRSGFATAAFVSAFPLDRRFGLIKGFQTYGDTMPRAASGTIANERPGRATADDAIAWLGDHRDERFFLWVHLFEPHAPYGDPTDGRPASARYDDEVAEADRQAGRVVEALGGRRAETLIVVAADHGEAFGEHGEIGHSLFIYDTTLRVPLAMAGPGIGHATMDAPVDLVDVAPTVLARLGVTRFDADGVDLSPSIAGERGGTRELYAETFAPLLDFGWSPLRSVRSGGFKYIAAPKPELYAVGRDPDEAKNLVADDRPRAGAMDERVQRISSASLARPHAVDGETQARLQALGYTSGAPATTTERPDPKDRRALAARIAQVTSGEVQGPALERALVSIVAEDPLNPQAQVRLGYLRLDEGRFEEAAGHFRKAIEGHLPGADAYLGLASSQAAQHRTSEALDALAAADEAEPGSAVVAANRGILLSDSGRPGEGIPFLQQALTLDPDMHEARFNLAVALARAGRPADAAVQARELLRRLPADAPQRPEVARLLGAVQ